MLVRDKLIMNVQFCDAAVSMTSIPSDDAQAKNQHQQPDASGQTHDNDKRCS